MWREPEIQNVYKSVYGSWSLDMGHYLQACNGLFMLQGMHYIVLPEVEQLM